MKNSILKDIKLIVTDLDGTLLHDNKSLDTNIKNVIKEKKYSDYICFGKKYPYHSRLYR